MALGGQVAKHGRHVNVLLDGGADEPAVEELGQRLHLVGRNHRLFDKIDLVLHNHCGYLVALVLHLALPILDRVEGCSIRRRKDQDGSLGAAVVRLCDAVELLLAGGVPQHDAHILAVDLDLSL